MFLKSSDPTGYVVTMGGRRYPVRGGVFLVADDLDPLLTETHERAEFVPGEVASELSLTGSWPADAAEEIAPPAVEAMSAERRFVEEPYREPSADGLDEISDEELAAKVLELNPDVNPGSITAAIADDRARVVEDVRASLAEQDAGEEVPAGGPTLEERINAVTSHAEANALGLELGLEFEAKKPGVAAKQEALREAAAEVAEKAAFDAS
jgi:hypothetical protein